MRLVFFVNDIATEKPWYSTTRLARSAVGRGHEVWYVGTDDFAYDPDETVRARVRRTPDRADVDVEEFLAAIQEDEAPQRIALDDVDVLMLRNDPADDYLERPWAQSVGIVFGELAVRHGVLVLNDPVGLSGALNKLYFQHFPASVRPRTLITRDHDEVRGFIDGHGGHAVLKPLQGSGGHSVFVVEPGDAANLNQMIDAVGRDGYIVVQEYLPAAAEGDVRLLLLDGRPLVVDGHYAAFRRRPSGPDPRSNITAGGHPEPVEVDERMLAVADAVRPKLLEDGMFLVGLDLAGDRLMEVNVFSPGGLYSPEQFSGVDFSAAVLAAVERKVEHIKKKGRGALRNAELAVM